MQAPTSTRIVKTVIWITALLSLFSPIVTYALAYYFNIPGPLQWFALSKWGLTHGWLWQPLTYFFIQSGGVGISISMLVSLAFHLYLLWFAGSEIAQRFGSKNFLFFYLGGGIFAAGLATLYLFLAGSFTAVVGSGPPVYALLVVWVMLHPELEFRVLLVWRLKARWLVAILLGLVLIMDLSGGQFAHFLVKLGGIIWGFAIGRLVWKLPNPFPLNIDWPWLQRRERRNGDGSQIINIEVLQESDEEFMDRMLDKIASEGEESLTRRERFRMDKISKGQ